MSDITTTQPWSPPEAKFMQGVIKYGSMLGLGAAAIYAFTLFAPTAIDALTLFETLIQDATHIAISLAGLVFVILVINSLFSSTGTLNRLLKLPFYSLANTMTRMIFTIDPLSPIKERLKQVRSDKVVFDEQFTKLDGMITNFEEQANQMRKLSSQAQQQGIAASKRGLVAAQSKSAHAFGSYKDMADTYQATADRLKPMRDTFQRVDEACDITEQNLTLDLQMMQKKWELQKSINAAGSAASRILGQSKTQTWNDAEECESIINDKYGEALGHIDHLKRNAEPFLESIDVQNGVYNEDMLKDVQDTSTKLLTSTAAIEDGGSNVTPINQAGNSPAFSNLIR